MALDGDVEIQGMRPCPKGPPGDAQQGAQRDGKFGRTFSQGKKGGVVDGVNQEPETMYVKPVTGLRIPPGENEDEGNDAI